MPYIAEIRLIEISEDDPSIETQRLCLRSGIEDDGALALKFAAQSAIHAICTLAKIASGFNSNIEPCTHVCSCTYTFCCVCDYRMIADPLAYSADERCATLKFKL